MGMLQPQPRLPDNAWCVPETTSTLKKNTPAYLLTIMISLVIYVPLLVTSIWESFSIRGNKVRDD